MVAAAVVAPTSAQLPPMMPIYGASIAWLMCLSSVAATFLLSQGWDMNGFGATGMRNASTHKFPPGPVGENVKAAPLVGKIFWCVSIQETAHPSNRLA